MSPKFARLVTHNIAVTSLCHTVNRQNTVEFHSCSHEWRVLRRDWPCVCPATYAIRVTAFAIFRVIALTFTCFPKLGAFLQVQRHPVLIDRTIHTLCAVENGRRHAQVMGKHDVPSRHHALVIKVLPLGRPALSAVSRCCVRFDIHDVMHDYVMRSFQLVVILQATMSICICASQSSLTA